MPDPEINPPPADTSAPAAPSDLADPSTPAARNRRSIGIIVAVMVLVMVLCCVCLLAVGIVWYVRQGTPPLFEDMLQVFTPALAQVVG